MTEETTKQKSEAQKTTYLTSPMTGYVQHTSPIQLYTPIFEGRRRNEWILDTNAQRPYHFRHYSSTQTLRNSGDPFFTMCQMGHKKLTTTQLYMHLVNLENDEWTCRAAATKEEAMSFIEGGFQYVTTIEGIHLFKKRK